RDVTDYRQQPEADPGVSDAGDKGNPYRRMGLHPRSHQAEEIQPTMLRREENARIEEVRELRDRVADLIERKRFGEAVEVAEDLIHRFPDTQVAGQLTREIDKLRKRAGMNDLL
ncbi:MAG: hypothetical protein NT031_11215, partial [Planctomycetota bacterium]|nr:hypothetical protein [Planctomycetota bacterium]